MSYTKDMLSRALVEIEMLAKAGLSVDDIADRVKLDPRIVSGLMREYLEFDEDLI